MTNDAGVAWLEEQFDRQFRSGHGEPDPLTHHAEPFTFDVDWRADEPPRSLLQRWFDRIR